MKLFIFLTVLILNLNTLFAQSGQWNNLDPKEKEIVQVIINIFDGMRQGDSAMVKKHFYPEVSSNTAFISKDGERVLKGDDINNWFNAIAKPHNEVWDERIWDYQVDIDGNLAAVWVKYAFYLDKEFHHCGVDAIQLAHDGKNRRVFHIADTRQVAGCEVPDHIANGATY